MNNFTATVTPGIIGALPPGVEYPNDDSLFYQISGGVIFIGGVLLVSWVIGKALDRRERRQRKFVNE